MLPRLAHKILLTRDSIGLLLLLGLFLFSACKPSYKEDVDKLNNLSYSYHYRNLDSARVYAQRALSLASNYGAGRAEAFNNLAFVSISKMDYRNAYTLLDSVALVTDNQVELLIADIQLMRLCQRESRNKEFYDYHEAALRRMHRIDEESQRLDEHLYRRMVYARSEFAVVTSTYYYYVGLEQPSIQAIEAINPDGEVRGDTAQLLCYYYNVGAGGIITNGTAEEIAQQEMDYLLRCYLSSVRNGYLFWQANSLQAISEHLQEKTMRDRLIADNLPAMKFLNVDNMPDSLLAGNLAQRSLDMFHTFGDVYQIAGAYRTLAQCYWHINDYRSAIICLDKALNENKAIEQAPDLVASIREQLSVTYSSIDDKSKSDYNRNIYLDLQDETRQDRYLESRAEQLERTSRQLNWMIATVIMAILIMIALFLLFDWLRRRQKRLHPLQQLAEPLQEWKRRNEQKTSEMESRLEEIQEDYALNVTHIINNKKRNLEQRAKVSLVNSITPLIDRMLHEIDKLQHTQETDEVRSERLEYIKELTGSINNYNGVLTQWIQLRQGELSLHIESFPLAQLFDIVKRGSMSFQMKGISLDVLPTADVVKADKILTLFMINTIADNARKYTAAGGKVTIGSAATDSYVEIFVEDTGEGMTQEQLAGIFDHKIANGHGFGLMNCKGIIEKYKKISQIFSVCTLSAESTLGKGSRFFFRLPRGIMRLLVGMIMLLPQLLFAAGSVNIQADIIDKASAYADSAFQSNIRGTYRQTLLFADSCRDCLNRYYKQMHPNSGLLMSRDHDVDGKIAEVEWFRSGMHVDYNVVLSIRNESAVAALALHDWQLYRYNNKVYTQLFKELSADVTLGDYCRAMQRSEMNKNIAIWILVVMLILLFPAYYFLFYRHRLYERLCVDRVKKINTILLSDMDVESKLDGIMPIATNRFPDTLHQIVQDIIDVLSQSLEKNKVDKEQISLLEDERQRARYEDGRLHVSNSILDNCLSTLKHETMYYPSRIHQLLEDKDQDLQSISELATFYKELYSILSMQAMRQVDSVRLQVSRLMLSDVVECSEDISLLGDPDMLRYMFTILQRQAGQDGIRVSVGAANGQYVDVKVLVMGLSLDERQCHDLFTPSVEHLPYLLCRQIVRDLGDATNARGCGIIASPNPAGTLMTITMVRSKEI